MDGRSSLLKGCWWVVRRFATVAAFGQWPVDRKLTLDFIKKVEEHWQKPITERVLSSGKPMGAKKYILAMFPYPSGSLHLGHVRVYSISDSLARYYALAGHQVLHPIGWDAFGLPAENAAFERKINPKAWTYANILTMKKQLQDFGCAFNWDRELATCDPAYYRWTQYLFLLLYAENVAYRKMSYVNWDPVDCTVLADEQIDAEGRSWRSGAKVEKKALRQWFVRTSLFTEPLLKQLNELKHWAGIEAIQRSWLGQCDTYKYALRLQDNDGLKLPERLELCVTQAELFDKAAFIALRSDHVLSLQFTPDTTGRLPVVAEHPFRHCCLPIFVSDDFPYNDHVHAYLGCPSMQNNRDREFAQRVGAKVLPGSFVLKEDKAVGGYLCSERLHGDWVVSRQRYWGTPIPMIHCPNCAEVPVPFEQLPVVLPDVDVSFTGGMRSPLASLDSWVNVPCPKCGAPAKRETDTLDTFFDSAWYFLRYLDPINDKAPFDVAKVDKWMPVDVYVGGREHATMHLYFARFMCHFLHSIGWLSVTEPFVNLLPQGMVKGKTYTLKSSGQFLPKDRVEQKGEAGLVDSVTGGEVIETWEKMSKSKHNGLNPQELIAYCGADLTRLLLMFTTAPQSDLNWSVDDLPGLRSWLARIFWLVAEFVAQRNAIDGAMKSNVVHRYPELLANKWEPQLKENYNYCVRMKCPADVIGNSAQFERCLMSLVTMLYPFAPHCSAELWAYLRDRLYTSTLQGDVWQQQWPQLDADADFDLEFYVNGAAAGKAKFDGRQLSVLTEEKCIEKALGEYLVKKRLKQMPLTNQRLERIDGYGAKLFLETEAMAAEVAKQRSLGDGVHVDDAGLDESVQAERVVKKQRKL